MCLVSWNIVMVAQSSGLFLAQLHVATSIFPHNELGSLFGLME